jgi:hypothetical protein
MVARLSARRLAAVTPPRWLGRALRVAFLVLVVVAIVVIGLARQGRTAL